MINIRTHLITVVSILFVKEEETNNEIPHAWQNKRITIIYSFLTFLWTFCRVTSEIAHIESFNVSHKDRREKEKRKFCLQEIEKEKKETIFHNILLL